MRAKLDRVLNPRSIAMIGGRQAELAIEQCDRLGFGGQLWPVHPTRSDIRGHRVYRSVDELPAPPDAAFVAVNRNETVAVVAALARRGAGGAVCYASGFAETGEEGAELQQRLVDHAMPVIGPNCYGIINGKLGAALWPDVHGVGRHIERGAALITQSGNIALNVTMNTQGVDFTHVISLGNQAGVRIEDCVTHLAADPAVAVIGIHAESIIDPVEFGRSMRVAHEYQTPVVILKTGISEAATNIAASHTGAISKPAQVYQALFDRYGVITVTSVNELVATLGFLVTVGPLPGTRMVSLSCSGGEASLVADRGSIHGIEFHPFDDDQASRIAVTLPDIAAITNPLDYHTFIWGNQTKLTACFTEALTGPADAAMLVMDWPNRGGDVGSWFAALWAIAAAHKSTGTPTVVAASLPENLPTAMRDRLQQDGIAVAYSIDAALAAVGAAAAVGRWLARPAPQLHTAAGRHHRATTVLDEADAKSILDEAGVTIPRSIRQTIGNLDIGDLRFPVVAKASGIAHKSDVGGVITGISDEVGLLAAASRLAPLGTEALIEEQVTDVVAELLVTVRREPPIGNVLVVGAGGALVELLDDTVTGLLPLTADHVEDLLGSLRVGRLLRGHRGNPAADVGAIVDTIDALTTLLADRPDIVEIEVNPLIATPHSAVAVDALITVAT